jgi:hypothetical protein
MKSTSTKRLPILLIVTVLVGTIVSIFIDESSAATTTTNTTLWITAWTFSFTKDTTSAMDSYFSHWPNAAAAISIWSYASSISAISANSSGDHRFTVSDMLGSSFTVTMQSSALTIAWGSIPATNIWYTWTTRFGTWKALIAAPTSAVDIWTAPVTFVSRTNNSGLSLFAQEITLKVAVPAAQAPGSYTGVITFTY